MTKDRIGIMVVIAVFGVGWLRQCGETTDAERFAAERDSVADVALDSASLYREQRDEWREAAESAQSAFEDSLLVWAPRVRQAQERAARAQRQAESRVEELLEQVAGDSVAVRITNELRAEYELALSAERERGDTWEQRALAAEAQIPLFESALDAAEGEIGQLRVALEARTAAEDALRGELRRQKAVGWLTRGLAGYGLLCTLTDGLPVCPG